MSPSMLKSGHSARGCGDDITVSAGDGSHANTSFELLSSVGRSGLASPPRRFERLTLALLVLTLFCIGVLVLLVIVDKHITDRNSAASERALDLTGELSNLDYDLKIIDISERAYALYDNSESRTRYNAVIGQLGERLSSLASLTNETPSERETMRILASYVARHVRATVPAIVAAHGDRTEVMKQFIQTIEGEDSITRIASVADALRDDVQMRRAGLLAQTARFDQYSTLALVTVLICTSVSFGALAYSVKRWLQDREETVALLHEAKLTAERASNAKTNFLALMSHELRTPLNAILGFAEIIRDRLLGPGKDEQYSIYAADIHSSGAHLLQLINKLLDVVQNGEGKTTLRLDDIDIGEIVQESLKMVRPQAEKGGVTLQSQIPAQLPVLHADGLRLTEIILNLLSNSVKFTPSGGTVTLTLTPLADTVEIRVEDSGTGIPAARMPSLFEPFGHVADPLSGARRGSGLGLSIAKHLTELHGGKLTITSQPGKGTIAVVVLPVSGGGEPFAEHDDRQQILSTVADG